MEWIFSKVKIFRKQCESWITFVSLCKKCRFDTWKFVKWVDLAGLRKEVSKLDIGKLQSVSVDLSKILDVVKNEVVKITMYDELVKNVNAMLYWY